MTIDKANYVFFLGGQDLEMAEIKSLLQKDGRFEICDLRLKWGAKASDYSAPIHGVLAQGCIPVLIELENDLGAHSFSSDDLQRIIWIDHHNERSGGNAPTSLEQVFRLLGLPQSKWTRRMALVAANDRGHIKEMRAMGATEQEVSGIRKEDRLCQGVSEEDEATAQKDLASGKATCNCIVVETSLASSTSIADLFALDPTLSSMNLLVFMQEKSAFYGSGDIIEKLADAIDGSWFGGSLPENGFWGSYETDRERLLQIVCGHFAS